MAVAALATLLACRFQPKFEEVQCSRGAFAIAMPPGAEEHQLEKGDLPDARAGTSVGVILRDTGPFFTKLAAFQASSYQRNDSAGHVALQAGLEREAAARAKELDAKIIAEGEGILGGLPAHRVVLQRGDVEFEFRYACKGDLIFEVGVTTSGRAIRENDRRFFFESFRPLNGGA